MHCLSQTVIILIIYVFTDSSFQWKVENKSCNGYGKKYPSVKAAMNKCLRSDCFAVMDNDCDGGSARICGLHKKGIHTGGSHCIYIRNGNILKDSL